MAFGWKDKLKKLGEDSKGAFDKAKKYTKDATDAVVAGDTDGLKKTLKEAGHDVSEASKKGVEKAVETGKKLGEEARREFEELSQELSGKPEEGEATAEPAAKADEKPAPKKADGGPKAG